MSVNSDNQLKFEEGLTEPLTIMNAGTEEFPFGSKFVVHIEPLDGKDHFMPSPGLEKKIKEGNVDIGDKITIEKVAKSEQYPYGYFSVNVVEKGKGPQIAKDRIAESPVGAGFAHKDAKDSQSKAAPAPQSSEPNDATKLNVLWNYYISITSEAGHKPGDEDIPF